MNDEDVAGADLNIYTSESALNEKLVAGYGLDSDHEGLKEPGKLFLIFNAPLDMWTARRKVSRRRYSCSDSPTSKSLHLFSTRHSGTSSGDRIRKSSPQNIRYLGQGASILTVIGRFTIKVLHLDLSIVFVFASRPYG